VKRELWCARSKHRLAWVEADETGELVVCVASAAGGHQRLSTGVSRFPAAYVRGPEGDPFTTQTVTAGCACRHRFTVELVSLLDGRPEQPERITGDDFPGVSFDH
jgi:hypothetical protein